jgi:Cu+-exporting ATPase
MTKDPVCGKQVDENRAPATTMYQGKKYSFCGQDCKNKFDQQPQHYSQASSQQQSKQQAQQEHVNR